MASAATATAEVAAATVAAHDGCKRGGDCGSHFCCFSTRRAHLMVEGTDLLLRTVCGVQLGARRAPRRARGRVLQNCGRPSVINEG
eukprot:CAMPEP_0177261912 /NCGR_PEP_ID=MMETSP0367-20130122/60086_1 /TAXON_ID=447022 ORGANISM="Scrippsiella hangoei-like, Strain SHHI-4" /NCGR_SAMPLE_ID=MMETSP0367 /ASSEMBLY_ACC=CAM_ASM_000362 /LENGTH=85 /DNA_ID=CAMNT_0018716611 /DNA_START=104 /DNA_END=357 /DNA_ORIENTATION=-